jgi:hypothetical protein
MDNISVAIRHVGAGGVDGATVGDCRSLALGSRIEALVGI